MLPNTRITIFLAAHFLEAMLNLTLQSRNKTASYKTSMMYYQGDALTLGLDSVRHNVLTSTSSKRHAYVLMNPSLSVHNVYTNMDLSVRVPEHVF